MRCCWNAKSRATNRAHWRQFRAGFCWRHQYVINTNRNETEVNGRAQGRSCMEILGSGRFNSFRMAWRYWLPGVVTGLLFTMAGGLYKKTSFMDETNGEGWRWSESSSCRRGSPEYWLTWQTRKFRLHRSDDVVKKLSGTGFWSLEEEWITKWCQGFAQFMVI